MIDGRHEECDGPRDLAIHVLDKWLSFRVLKRLSNLPYPMLPIPPPIDKMLLNVSHEKTKEQLSGPHNRLVSVIGRQRRLHTSVFSSCLS